MHANAANGVRGVIQPHKFTCGSAQAAADAAARGPGKPPLEHGHRIHPHLAAGLAEWTTHNSEDFSSCTLSQEHPFE